MSLDNTTSVSAERNNEICDMVVNGRNLPSGLFPSNSTDQVVDTRIPQINPVGTGGYAVFKISYLDEHGNFVRDEVTRNFDVLDLQRGISIMWTFEADPDEVTKEVEV